MRDTKGQSIHCTHSKDLTTNVVVCVVNKQSCMLIFKANLLLKKQAKIFFNFFCKMITKFLFKFDRRKPLLNLILEKPSCSSLDASFTVSYNSANKYLAH